MALTAVRIGTAAHEDESWGEPVAAPEPAPRPAVGAREARAINVLLGHHFGDGLVYLQGSQDRYWLGRAIELGLVSDEGYLTSSGYRYWLRQQ